MRRHGKELLALHDPYFSVKSAAFSKDGRRVLLVSARAKNKSHRELPDNKKPPATVDPALRRMCPWSPLTTVRFGGGGAVLQLPGLEFGPMRLFDADSGKQIAALGRDDEPMIEVEETGGFEYSVYLDLEGKKVVRVNNKEVTVDPTVDQGECAAFSPDGTRVAVACWQGTVRVLGCPDRAASHELERQANRAAVYRLQPRRPTAAACLRRCNGQGRHGQRARGRRRHSWCNGPSTGRAAALPCSVRTAGRY